VHAVSEAQKLTTPQKATVRNENSQKSTVNAERLFTKLNKCNSQAGWCQNYPTKKEVEVDVPLPPLHTVSYQFHDSVRLDSVECVDTFKQYYDGLVVLPETSKKIETSTRGQSDNSDWARARLGRITSSKFGNVMTRKVSTAPDNLVKDCMGYRDRFENTHTRWGIGHESAARRKYAIEHQKKHSSIKVVQCGLLVSPEFPHLGASPDGLVSCKDCSPCRGLVEIKCPSKFKMATPIEAASDTSFCCQLNQSGELELKKSHIYYYQVQGQMAISQRTWCDFVIWTLKGISVERIYFDEVLWKRMREKLAKFYLNGIIPELFSSRVRRGTSLY
jgi:hypothetical protein